MIEKLGRVGRYMSLRSSSDEWLDRYSVVSKVREYESLATPSLKQIS